MQPTDTPAHVPDSEAPNSSSKPKAKASRELKRILQVERSMAKVMFRLGKSATLGTATYIDRRDRSAEKRRDGAFKDAPVNVARAMSHSMRIASRAPFEFVNGIDTDWATKRARKLARNFMRGFRR